MKEIILTIEEKNYDMIKNILTRLFETEIENQINWALEDKKLGFVDKDNTRDLIKQEMAHLIAQLRDTKER